MDELAVAAIHQRFALLSPVLDERRRRRVAAAEALTIGRGGGIAVARATGVSRRAMHRGVAQLQHPAPLPTTRVRRPGGGRKRTVDTDRRRRADLDRLVEPVSRGDPASPLRWTWKSVPTVTTELRRLGHQTSHRMVADLLPELGYSLQANRKLLEGSSHPDRDAQFA